MSGESLGCVWCGLTTAEPDHEIIVRCPCGTGPFHVTCVEEHNRHHSPSEEHIGALAEKEGCPTSLEGRRQVQELDFRRVDGEKSFVDLRPESIQMC